MAEDNADDVLLMKLAFRKAGLDNPIHVVMSGSEAIEYLKGALQAKTSGSRIPLLISLDINMPQVSGHDVLNWIRSQPPLDSVPVVVVSQSDEGRDANRAVQLGARSYLVKPSSFQDLVEMMKVFKSLLLQVEQSRQGRSPAQKRAGRPAGNRQARQPSCIRPPAGAKDMGKAGVSARKT